MDRPRLAELQAERLRATAEHVYNRVEPLRQRMDSAGVRPDHIKRVADIRHLPFMEKTDLRDFYPFGLFAVPMDQIVRLHATSGTTGKPTVTGYTGQDLDHWTEMMARTVTAGGAGAGDIIQIAYGYGMFTGGLGVHQGATRVGAAVAPTSSGNTERQIMFMRDFGTTMLACTPSYALHIGETIRELGIPLSELKLKYGIFGAEPWTAQMRVEIEKLLGVRAIDIYGMAEICGPGVATECYAQDGMHIAEDHVIPEIIDQVTGEPLPYGQAGELVLTAITKRGMPMIRYRTHDIATLNPEPCVCGRTHMRITRLTGRTDDMLIIRGVNVFPSQIEAVLVGIHGVAPHYMLVVGREGALDTLEVQVEVTEAMFSDEVRRLEALEREISAKILSVVGVSARVRLVGPRQIGRSEGKAQRVRDNRKP